MDNMYLSPNVSLDVKTLILDHADERKIPHYKPGLGKYSMVDNNGEPLRNSMAIALGKKPLTLPICFAYNELGCNTPECPKLHVCRGSKCGFASHKFDIHLCKVGRKNLNTSVLKLNDFKDLTQMDLNIGGTLKQCPKI